MRLKDKVAIVTGAGRGIGRAIAMGYAREGARVVVNYSRSQRAAEDAVEEIRAAGGRAVAVQADIAEIDAHASLIERTLAEFGALDILVNNAGVEINEPVLESTPETWEQTVSVNLKGAYFLACAVARVMARGGGGKIVNISSVHDVEPLRNRAVYSITKSGLLMLVKSLALELAEHNIHVNAISPGAILTDMNRKHLTDPARRERLLTQIPLKRIGVPQDIVGAAVFLASPESDYVTGTTIYVDGGLLLL
jgi:NAD(P)-dependent dehydrogenase (short-subunit alcohol dehydrogenase family)